ncbi:hypothetical protein [Rhodohalobacter sp.]
MNFKLIPLFGYQFFSHINPPGSRPGLRSVAPSELGVAGFTLYFLSM